MPLEVFEDQGGAPDEPMSPEVWLWLQLAQQQAVEQWSEWQQAVESQAVHEFIFSDAPSLATGDIQLPVPALPQPKVKMVPPSVKDIGELLDEYEGVLDLTTGEIRAYGAHLHNYLGDVAEDYDVDVIDLFGESGSIWNAVKHEPELMSAVLGASLSSEAALGILFAIEHDQTGLLATLLPSAHTVDPLSAHGQTSYGGYRGLTSDVPLGWEYVLWSEATGQTRAEYWANPNFIYTQGDDLHPTLRLSDYMKMSNYEFETSQWQKALLGALLVPGAHAVDHTTRYSRGFFGLDPLPEGTSRWEALGESFFGAYDVLTWGAMSDVRYGVEERDPIRVGFGVLGVMGLGPLARGLSKGARNLAARWSGEWGERVSIVGFRGTGFKATEYAQEHPLIQAGHIGLDVNASSLPGVYGFHPSQEALDYLRSQGIEPLDFLKEHGALRGQVQDDVLVFERAVELGEQGAGTNAWQLDVPVSSEEYGRILLELESQTRTGSPYPSWYRFPTRDGMPMPPQCNNCATFPQTLGIDIPEITGQVKTYMAAMTGAGATPWYRPLSTPLTLPSPWGDFALSLTLSAISRTGSVIMGYQYDTEKTDDDS